MDLTAVIQVYQGHDGRGGYCILWPHYFQYTIEEVWTQLPDLGDVVQHAIERAQHQANSIDATNTIRLTLYTVPLHQSIWENINVTRTIVWRNILDACDDWKNDALSRIQNRLT